MSGLATTGLAVEILDRAIESGKTVHAYLISGGTAEGQQELALRLVAALNCAAGSGRPCGTCLSCRKVSTGNHPDLHLLRPEGATFKIGQVRQLQANAWMKPREGRCQVFILAGADQMTSEAANSLLKILEEPPAGSVFCLLAPRPQTLPPTVVSRCQPLVLGQAESGTTGEIPATAREIVAAWPELDELGALRRAESLEGGKTGISALVDRMALLVRDLLVFKKSGDETLLLLPEEADFTRSRSGTWADETLLEVLGALDRARYHLLRNANPRLVAEVMLLSLRPGMQSRIIK